MRAGGTAHDWCRSRIAMMRARVRQLRDGLIMPVARVRAGGAITVIHPGRCPTALERLIAEGVVRPPVHPKRPAPYPVVADVSLSRSVIDDRQ